MQENLFTEEKKGIVPDLDNWVQYFSYESIINLNKLLKDVNYKRIKEKIYPPQHQVLRIFKDLKPEDVKVIILGQDPYHDGNANGYAFGVSKKVSPSLHKIWESINKDVESTLIDCKPEPSLRYLVKQGVMLLNTSLTVREGEPNSHTHLGWKIYIKEFISNFSNINPNVVYMLWGNDAKDFSKWINPVKNLVLTHTHPAYASYQKIEWGCTHFSQANQYLKEKNKLIINWR